MRPTGRQGAFAKGYENNPDQTLWRPPQLLTLAARIQPKAKEEFTVVIYNHPGDSPGAQDWFSVNGSCS